MRYSVSRTANKLMNVGQLQAVAQLEAHGQIPRLYTYAPWKRWDVLKWCFAHNYVVCMYAMHAQ